MLGGGDPDCRPARRRRVCSGPSLVGSWLGDPGGHARGTPTSSELGGSAPLSRRLAPRSPRFPLVSLWLTFLSDLKRVWSEGQSRGAQRRGGPAPPRSRIVQGRSGLRTLSRHPQAPGQTAPSQGWRGKRSHPFLLSCWTSVKGSMRPQSRICCPQGKVTAVQTDREVAAKVWAPARLSSSQASVSPQRSEARRSARKKTSGFLSILKSKAE